MENFVSGPLSSRQFAHRRQLGSMVESDFAQRAGADHSRRVLTDAKCRTHLCPGSFYVPMDLIVRHASTIRALVANE